MILLVPVKMQSLLVNQHGTKDEWNNIGKTSNKDSEDGNIGDQNEMTAKTAGIKKS